MMFSSPDPYHAPPGELGGGSGTDAPAPSAAPEEEDHPGPVLGVDLSKFQGTDVDFAAIKAAGHDYAFLKATEGNTLQDATYAAHYTAARAAGLMVGAYHFYITRDQAQSQFENFSSHVTLQSGDLPPVVDAEIMHGGTEAFLRDELRKFLGLLEDHYGVQPIIYAGVSFANAHLAGFADYPLWVAHYTSAAQPHVPADWKVWTFWQYTQTGTVAGVSGNVDVNRFNGGSSQLKKFLLA